MKTFVTLGLLTLLLAHSLGWSLAVLCNGPKNVAAERVAIEAGNATAWHTFTELSDRLMQMDKEKASPTPWSTVLKLAGDLAKSYLPGYRMPVEWGSSATTSAVTIIFAEVCGVCKNGVSDHHTPPPEMIG